MRINSALAEQDGSHFARVTRLGQFVDESASVDYNYCSNQPDTNIDPAVFQKWLLFASKKISILHLAYTARAL